MESTRSIAVKRSRERQAGRDFTRQGGAEERGVIHETGNAAE